VSAWEGLTPPYATIVADPPWHYDAKLVAYGGMAPFPYSTMTLDEIAALPVGELAATDALLYLWTTNRHLRDAFDVLHCWGFRYAQTLVWAKPPRGLIGGATYTIRTEFVIVGRRGALATQKVDRNWWEWPTTAHHSAKPAAFCDLVEQVSPGPYVELFARAPRLGWDSWGLGYEERVS
jgi:N6-adenosine-specific RNA methylase IME4